MRCVWCDSEYTFSGGEHVPLEDVMKQVRAFGCRLVEITGGEPLAQPEARTLIGQLCDEGFEVLIETGGYFSTAVIDYRAAIILDVKCPASGEEERNHWPNLRGLRAEQDEVKFVIATDGIDAWAAISKAIGGISPRIRRMSCSSMNLISFLTRRGILACNAWQARSVLPRSISRLSLWSIPTSIARRE